MSILRILVVDDHAIVREGLTRLLGEADPQWQVTEASGGAQALERLRRENFDLALLDLSMPGIGGLELIRRLRADHPQTHVLVLSMHAEEEYALRAIKAGAQGYVTKDRATTELVTAVRKVAAGGVYVTPQLVERVVLQLNGMGVAAPSHADLSDRELDVLRRIVAGQRLTDIAHDLHLSVKTISTHKTRILHKLGLSSAAALVRYGIEHGL